MKCSIRQSKTGRIAVSIEYRGIKAKSAMLDPIIDTGAEVSVLGKDVAVSSLGYTNDFIKGLNCVLLSGITSATEVEFPMDVTDLKEPLAMAYLLEIENIAFQDIIINKPTVLVPFRMIKVGKFEYIQKTGIVIGTDILRKYNYSVNIDNQPYFEMLNPLRQLRHSANRFTCVELKSGKNKHFLENIYCEG